jgi:hypothetical protein
VLLSSVFLVLLAVGLQYEWNERFWPFSTGTEEPAFLSTTFGMSPPEVRRSLAAHHATVLSYEDYKRESNSPLIEVFGVPAVTEDAERQKTLYMPGIQMFDANVEAEFEFRDDRLRYVGVHFDPLSAANTTTLIGRLDALLRETSKFMGREESKEIPGAYTLRFAGTSKSSLWINPTDPDKRYILLGILSPTLQSREQREIEKREQAAFGRR